MNYQIRNATKEDLPRIEEIYAYARQFMENTGNPTQWGQNHPAQHLLDEDISLNRLYVVESGERLCGVFMFEVGITKQPALSFFREDKGILQRLFVEHTTNPEFLVLSSSFFTFETILFFWS